MVPSPVPVDWRAILAIAIRTPSPHNVQPWRIRIVSATEADLLVELCRTLPREDLTGSFIILTMGLFVESLRLVAATHGLALDVHPAHEPAWFAAEHLLTLHDTAVPFARLMLRPDPAATPAYPLDVFLRRRTSRLPYGPEPISAPDAARVAAVASRCGHQYGQRQDPALIERLLGLNVEAVFEDLSHAPYREEMRGWLRYFDGASRRHRDGLDARCMHVSAAELWMPFHWPSLLHHPLTRPWLARRYRRQIGPVATMGFLTGPFWDPADAYRTGRALLHVWLECTALGWSIHPYGNLVTNRRIAMQVEAATGLRDIWLAFKIGRSPTPPESRRRSVEEVLIA